MDLAKEIRRVADTGKVIFGTERTLKAMKNKNVKLVVYSKNCSEGTKNDILYYSKLSKIPTIEFHGTSIDLGTLCGKPFIVSVMGVVSAGESNILAVEAR